MSHDNYGQFPNQGQSEGGQGQSPGQNGGAPGQQNDQANMQPMQYPQDGQPMGSPTPGSDGKTTLWYVQKSERKTRLTSTGWVNSSHGSTRTSFEIFGSKWVNKSASR